MSANLAGQIERYFDILGGIGRQMEATSSDGTPLSVDDAIARALAMVTAAKARESRIFFVGNGGSAGIASHMTTDWMKNGGFAALCCNDGSQLTCLANDLGYEQVFAKPITMHGRPGDVLIAISSSGNSPNIVAAVAAARQRSLDVITLSGFKPDNKLRMLGDINFYVGLNEYGFVEIGHLAICHAILDFSMGWRAPLTSSPPSMHAAGE